MKGLAAVAGQGAAAEGRPVQLVQIAGGVVEALRPEKIAVPGRDGPDEGEVLVQVRLRAGGGELKVPGPALGVEARRHGHGLQQGGFARAVLPHQTGDGMRKGKLGQVAQGGNVAQIALLRDARPIDLQALDKIAVHGNLLFLRYAIKCLEYITPLFICIGINAYDKQAGNRPESLRGAHCLCA